MSILFEENNICKSNVKCVSYTKFNVKMDLMASLRTHRSGLQNGQASPGEELSMINDVPSPGGPHSRLLVLPTRIAGLAVASVAR